MIIEMVFLILIYTVYPNWARSYDSMLQTLQLPSETEIGSYVFQIIFFPSIPTILAQLRMKIYANSFQKI